MKADITLLSASAGSGKTYSLTERLTKLLSGGIRPEGIVATTFTKRAANELVARARSLLLSKGQSEIAHRLLDGYIGTVNSVCGAILSDYAFEAGLSPTLEVLPDDHDTVIFRTAIAEVVRNQGNLLRPTLSALELTNSWEDQIKEIIDAARANGIDQASLRQCAKQSWDSFQALLPPPLSASEADALDRELAREINWAIAKLPKTGDTTKTTIKARESLLEVFRSMRDGKVRVWSDWCRLASIATGSKSEDMVSALKELASQMLGHPRLQNDIKQCIYGFFDCAADAMGCYQQYKKDLGLIDFTDQEVLALRLLDDESVRGSLKERIDLLLVDEFQDTSPIQLALFLRLADIAGKSIWVGDQKQSIYSFRGTDPRLMEEVISSLHHVEVLDESWRSQPALVKFTNELFTLALEPHGVPADQVRLTPQVSATNPASPHIKCWRLQSTKQEQDASALAAGIVNALAAPDHWVILDKETRRERSLKAGDIAVLCRRNDDCIRIANALEALGVRAAIPRPGLLSRPETVLALAAFRYLVDGSDLLAVAEMARLMGPGDDPGWWLQHARPMNLQEVGSRLPALKRLDEARSRLLQQTAAEMLDVAITLSGVRRIASTWGHSHNRLANLDMLRGYAIEYEDLCSSQRNPCTPIGLLEYLKGLKKRKEDKQAEGVGDDAVQVLTYHRSKGLEWPVVVLTGLNSGARSNVYGLSVVSPDQVVDLANPLAGRWLRYWPWPFGDKKTMQGLDSAVEVTDLARQDKDVAQREQLRLLYVGMTRARDHMVLTARCPKKEGETLTSWIDSCVDVRGESILTLPTEEGVQQVPLGESNFDILTVVLAPSDVKNLAKRLEAWAPQAPADIPPHPCARFVFSTEIATGRVGARVLELGPPLDIPTMINSARLGSAVHAFLGAVPGTLPVKDRLKWCRELLADWGVPEIEPIILCEAQDRLLMFLEREYPGAQIVHEWPVHLRKGLQQASGWVDLLLRTPEGNIIVDHKTSTGTKEYLSAKAAGYAGQLRAYGEAMAEATGKPTLGIWVHFPFAGILVELA